MNVTGGSDLGSDSLCALVSGGNLTIHGDGADKTQFRGLVYSYGELNVSDVTIVGSLVGASASGRPMTVERANLVYDPEGVVIDLDLQWSWTVGPPNISGRAKLNQKSKFSPAWIAEHGRPSSEELMDLFLFDLPGSPAEFIPWSELTESDKRANEDLTSQSLHKIAAQLGQLDPPSIDPAKAEFHLDLDRFLSVRKKMVILARTRN